VPAGQSIGGYVVTRIDDSHRTIACRVVAAVSQCHDAQAPAGEEVSYTVHAVMAGWSGRDSAESAEIAVPPTTAATGTDSLAATKPATDPPTTPDPAAAPSVDEPAAVNPSPASTATHADPAPADSADSEPVATIAPTSDPTPSESSSSDAPAQ
jgi:hypothetical protein